MWSNLQTLDKLQRFWRGGGGRRRLAEKILGRRGSIERNGGREEKKQEIDVISEGEGQEIQMVTGETKVTVKRFAAKHRLDANATAKLENSSDSVAEQIIETPMGHVNNPSV